MYTHTYNISGVTCQNCIQNVQSQLLQLNEITQVNISDDKSQLIVTTNNPISLENLQKALPSKYTISEINRPNTNNSTNNIGKQGTKFQQLKPLFLIIFYIASATVLLHYKQWSWNNIMLDFMGLFYIVFSFFKMLDLKGFPDSFAMYDPLAKKSKIYAWAYPFIETALGLMLLMRFEVTLALIFTLIILGITTVGVTKTLLNKKSIQCACLGTALKLPMTEATFIENSIMIVMAALMLLN